jgi:hypothetical protein
MLGNSPNEAAGKVHHDIEDQRAYLRDLQRNWLPQGEATIAGNSQSLPGEVRGLCRQGKNCGRLRRPYFGFSTLICLKCASLRVLRHLWVQLQPIPPIAYRAASNSRTASANLPA